MSGNAVYRQRFHPLSIAEPGRRIQWTQVALPPAFDPLVFTRSLGPFNAGVAASSGVQVQASHFNTVSYDTLWM